MPGSRVFVRTERDNCMLVSRRLLSLKDRHHYFENLVDKAAICTAQRLTI